MLPVSLSPGNLPGFLCLEMTKALWKDGRSWGMPPQTHLVVFLSNSVDFTSQEQVSAPRVAESLVSGRACWPGQLSGDFQSDFCCHIPPGGPNIDNIFFAYLILSQSQLTSQGLRTSKKLVISRDFCFTDLLGKEH